MSLTEAMLLIRHVPAKRIGGIAVQVSDAACRMQFHSARQ